MTFLRTCVQSLALLVLPATGIAAGGLGNADEINVGGGGGSVDLKATIISIMQTILSYVALLAVVMIVIAGLYLILGMGSDSSKETAKKIVLYTIIGLLIILVARALVTFVIDLG